VSAVTARREALCFGYGIKGWETRSSKMSYHQRPHELRLAISFEAEALISSFGDDAYGEARRRAEEASNTFLAKDWNEVALAVTRKTAKHSSLLARMFH
jgi:hypothetical protein